jgi:hypothetical protein
MYVVEGGDGVRILNQQGPAAHRALLLRPPAHKPHAPERSESIVLSSTFPKICKAQQKLRPEGTGSEPAVLCYSRIVIVLLVVLNGVDEA